MKKFNHVWCGMWTKHANSILHFAGTKMYLECHSCGFKTPGIDVKSMPKQVMTQADIRAAFDELMDVEMGLGCGG